jgi:hypothetical protein
MNPEPPKRPFQFRIHHLIFLMLVVAVAAATVRNSLTNSPTYTAFDWAMIAAFLLAVPYWIVSIRRLWKARHPATLPVDEPKESPPG